MDDLYEALSAIIVEQKQELMDERQQLEAVEQMEETLREIGVDIQPKFEIPLESRVATTVK